MRIILAVVLVLFGLGANCAGCPPPQPTPVPTPSDSGVLGPDTPVVAVTDVTPPTPQTPCQKMCSHLLQLSCPEAEKYGLIKCGETCEHVLSSDIINLNIELCISATTKSQVQACGIKCK